MDYNKTIDDMVNEWFKNHQPNIDIVDSDIPNDTDEKLEEIKNWVNYTVDFEHISIYDIINYFDKDIILSNIEQTIIDKHLKEYDMDSLSLTIYDNHLKWMKNYTYGAFGNYDTKQDITIRLKDYTLKEIIGYYGERKTLEIIGKDYIISYQRKRKIKKFFNK